MGSRRKPRSSWSRSARSRAASPGAARSSGSRWISTDALTPPTGLVVAGVDQQPLEPGLEAAGVAQAADVAPGVDEALLDRVLAPVRVVQDAIRQREQSVIRGAREHVECLVIAALCPLDQVTLHRRSGMERRLRSSPSIDGWDRPDHSIFAPGATGHGRPWRAPLWLRATAGSSCPRARPSATANGWPQGGPERSEGRRLAAVPGVARHRRP